MSEALRAYREVVSELTGAGAPFELREVVAGEQTVRLFADTAENLSDLYADVLARHAGKDMIEHRGERRSYREMHDEAAALGAALRTHHGIGQGDRVGIAMRNLPQWFTAFIAVTRIGAVATLINSRGASDEIAAAIARVGCRLVFADDRCAARLAEAGADVIVLDLASLAALAARGGEDEAPVRVPADAPAAILFTSGTTGRPKGATLSHRNLASMAANVTYLGRVGMTLAARRAQMPVEALIERAPPPSVLMIFPLFHISGVTNFFMASVGAGLMTLIDRWDPADAVRLIEKNKVNAIAGPSMVMADLLDQPNAEQRLATLSSIVIGGQATPVALAERIARLLPRTGQGAGWGMTEMTGSATSASGAIFKAFPGSCGVTLPLFDLRIAGSDGAVLPAGEPGEILVRGAMVTTGYYNDPEATSEAIQDGWLRTGDLGYLDENGMLFIVDRRKDMVISAGENIYCAEIERVLGAHPDVLEVAMFGVPDERLGERAVAIVTPLAGSSIDIGSVRSLAKESLADYKVPSEIIVASDLLPRNDLGKVDKKRLRSDYLERQSARC